MADQTLNQNVPDMVDEFSTEIVAAADKFWQLAEIGLQEHQSTAYFKEALKAHDFRITHDRVGSLDTAFVAEYGAGEPVIAILAEYDALPGLGNEAVPYKQPRTDGLQNGHGCGHNLIGAGALGAALAVRTWLEQSGAPGTLRLMGCPAEENANGKVFMAREGVFDGIDAALHWHPMDRMLTAHIRTAAICEVKVEFFGKTAHAGNSPWDGRSALHALELFTHGINLMREHMYPTARIQYLITRAGEAVNVIPDYTSATVDVRELTIELAAAGIDWVKDIATGAALATQTRCKVTPQSGSHDLMSNTPLAEHMQAVLERLGAPIFSAEEQEFARAVQKNNGLPEKGLLTGLAPLPNEPSMGGSTDVGDVSKLTPTIGLAMPSIPEGISLHTWGATACHGMSIGHKAAIQASKGLALMACNLFTESDLRQAARADFDRRMNGRAYIPLGLE